jgi:CarboxypepD_reg-like domain
MTTIPKPKSCSQNWLEMTPTEGGRLCGQCHKTIVDFTKMSWAEIAQIQLESNNTVCGMYKPKQLEYWGQEIPNCRNKLLKVAIVTGLAISLPAIPYAQNSKSDTIVITGKVTDSETGEGLTGALITLKNSKTECLADIKGTFKLLVKDISEIPMPDTLEIRYVGYATEQIIINDFKQMNNPYHNVKVEEGELNVEMIPVDLYVTNFTVSAPTFRDRLRWNLRKWFGRK